MRFMSAVAAVAAIAMIGVSIPSILIPNVHIGTVDY